MDIKLIALDMDGTVLDSNDHISDYTKKVLKQAIDQHIHVVFSTGRTLKTCYPYAQEVGLESYLVTVNGGEIWTMEKHLLQRHLLDPTVMEKMYRNAKHIGLSTWMVSTSQVYFDDCPEDVLSDEWLKFGAHSIDEAELEKFIKEASYFQGLELTNSLPTNVEVNPEGVSKASALERVCSEIGITMNEVMAIGDSLNDMKMIQTSGIGVAMKNGQEAIRQAADYITDSNDQHGVAKAVERFVLH